MTTKNFKVRKGLEIGDSISITDAGVVTGLTTDNLSQGTTNEYYTNAKVDARITSGAITGALGYTPENSANKGTANGYAPLDGTSKIASTYLPSYVDDVLEYADLAALPVTGETGKIYVAQDTNKIYRWSGSAYIEISPSPGSTDSVAEGSVNLYFTQSRSRQSISVTDSGGDGSLGYDNSTGVITYTGPSATEVRAHFTGGDGVSITNGDIALDFTEFSTTDITEGTNLYYTTVRANSDFDTRLATKDTDDLNEGTTNQYFTNARARTAISATDSGGDGSLSYDNSTGVITYTGPSATEVRAHFTGGTGVTITNGSIAIGQPVATTSDVTFGSVSTATLKSNNATTAITLADTTGDATFASRLLSSASKTIRTGPNRTTSFASVSGATSEDILIQGIGASGVPYSGLVVTNSGLPTGSTSGRRQGILIRDFGGHNYNGSSTTIPEGAFLSEASRGTISDPRSLPAGGPLGALQGYSNAGSDLASGNTPYWTSEKYPRAPVFGLLANQTHKGPWGTAAAAAQFTADISGTTLNVTAVSSGTIQLGHEIKLSTGANFPTTTNAFQIIGLGTGTGGTGTYNLNASPGTVASTAMFSTVTTLGTQFFANVVPQNTPITTASRVTQQISADNIIFRAQSGNVNTNIFSVTSWPTTVFAGVAGTGNGFVQGTNKNYFTISDTTTTISNILQVSGPIKSQGIGFTLTDSTGVQVTGNNVNYNRVFGQFELTSTVTPAAASTAYVFPLGAPTYNNIAAIGSTSRLIPGAAGYYNIQFSVQADNADNANDHELYIWLKKNGTDVTGSTGRMTLPKTTSGSLKIITWNYIVQSSNTTDYFELAYAVDDTNITFPAFSALAFAPSTASLIVTITPVGI